MYSPEGTVESRNVRSLSHLQLTACGSDGEIILSATKLDPTSCLAVCLATNEALALCEMPTNCSQTCAYTFAAEA
jgi:hypothetical protein